MSILLYHYYYMSLSSAGSQSDGFIPYHTFTDWEKAILCYLYSLFFYFLPRRSYSPCYCWGVPYIHVYKESRFMPSWEHTTLFSLRQIPQQYEILSLFHYSWKSYKDEIIPSNWLLPSYTQHNYHASFTTNLNHKFLCFAHGPSFSAFKTRNLTYVSRGK